MTIIRLADGGSFNGGRTRELLRDAVVAEVTVTKVQTIAGHANPAPTAANL